MCEIGLNLTRLVVLHGSVNYPVFLIYGGMEGARALVQVPLDRWRFSRHFGISHISLTSLVFEL